MPYLVLSNEIGSSYSKKGLIPNEALVVAALGITLATQGWGASLINSLSGTLSGQFLPPQLQEQP